MQPVLPYCITAVVSKSFYHAQKVPFFIPFQPATKSLPLSPYHSTNLELVKIRKNINFYNMEKSASSSTIFRSSKSIFFFEKREKITVFREKLEFLIRCHILLLAISFKEQPLVFAMALFFHLSRGS